jgi:carbonic anhydrase
MRKSTITAALCFAVYFSAQAQAAFETTVYIGKSSIENAPVTQTKKKFNYTRDNVRATETIENIQADTTYFIDWVAMDITINGDVYKIDEYKTDAYKDTMTIFYKDEKMMMTYRGANVIAYTIQKMK